MTEQQRAYILEHGVKVEGIGTMMNLSDVPNMNTNERKPLLSDEKLYTMSGYGGMNAWEKYVADAVRDYYEDLITTGKLRVVEEVELDFGDYLSTRCKCGTVHLVEDEFNYCPGCGNKIKR